MLSGQQHPKAEERKSGAAIQRNLYGAALQALHKQFPDLVTPVHWGDVEAIFAPRRALPPRSLISNVNIVPFVSDQAVVLRLPDWRPELPGGTLEPGETYLVTLRRELAEEAGARLRSFTLLGAWSCHSSASEAYRPHLPHPRFYRVAGYGNIELVMQPTNPDGSEVIAEVSVVSIAEAASLFRRWQRPDIAASYQAAALYRQPMPTRVFALDRGS